LKLRAFAGERKHLVLCLVKALRSRWIVAAAVLAVLPQRELKELRRDIVVLFVRSLRQDRDGALAKPADKDTLVLPERLDAAAVLLAKALLIECPDTGADELIRQATGLCKFDDHAHRARVAFCQRLRISSTRFRFTPRSDVPSRDAERMWMTLALSSARNSTSSTNRKSRLVNSTCR